MTAKAEKKAKKNKDFKIDYSNKTIRTTKLFYDRASVWKSEEYKILKELKEDFPDFQIQCDKITVKTTKRTHKGLTFKQMNFYINEISNDKALHLAEFNRIAEEYKGQKQRYAKVKQWFIETFPDYDIYYQSKLEGGANQERQRPIERKRVIKNVVTSTDFTSSENKIAS